MIDRRKFLRTTSRAVSLLPFTALPLFACTSVHAMERAQRPSTFFKLSLAQWSYHRALLSGEMDHLDFAETARRDGCSGVEYVNRFFLDKAKDRDYLKQMKARTSAAGVENVLIMIGRAGQLASPDETTRMKAIEKHKPWVDAAAYLGCHAVRVDLRGAVEAIEASRASVDSLQRLAEYAAGSGLSVLVENHGGFTSNGAWLASVMKKLNTANTGTLPDFGNFCIEKNEKKECMVSYDRYLGMEEVMPYAKGVSAKSYSFDQNGMETTIDFGKILRTVKASGYRGYIGIEWEGSDVSEREGVRLTRELLLREAGKLGK